MDLNRILQVGTDAAYKASHVLQSYLGNAEVTHKKSAKDLVTQADTASEEVIKKTIRKAFPNHGILAEESGLDSGTEEGTWIIDPLDGTTNFAHGLALFAVSIAFHANNEPLVGLVLDPISGELFTAISGRGAKFNGHRISVSGTPTVAESFLVTGFPYKLDGIFSMLMDRFAACVRTSQGVRRLGSAALDLCYVACGRFDGFWEQNLCSWDTAAGALIAKEASGMVTDFSNCPFTDGGKEILATNGRIHEEMISILNRKGLNNEKR